MKIIFISWTSSKGSRNSPGSSDQTLRIPDEVEYIYTHVKSVANVPLSAMSYGINVSFLYSAQLLPLLRQNVD